MRKVKMKRSVAGRRNTYTKGDEVDVPDAICRSLVAAGHAEDITPDGYEPDPTDEVVTEPDPDGESGSEDQAEDDGLDELSVADLKEIAKERELPTSGSKAELIERIRASVVTEPDADGESGSEDQA